MRDGSHARRLKPFQSHSHAGLGTRFAQGYSWASCGCRCGARIIGDSSPRPTPDTKRAKANGESAGRNTGCDMTSLEMTCFCNPSATGGKLIRRAGKSVRASLEWTAEGGCPHTGKSDWLSALRVVANQHRQIVVLRGRPLLDRRNDFVRSGWRCKLSRLLQQSG